MKNRYPVYPVRPRHLDPRDLGKDAAAGVRKMCTADMSFYSLVAQILEDKQLRINIC